MILLIESLILCVLFTLPIVTANRNPVSMIHDYPPAIIAKVRELVLPAALLIGAIVAVIS